MLVKCIISSKFQKKAIPDTKIGPLKIANESYTFTSTLANLINASFEQGFFPDSLKIAEVVPVHKEGCKSDVSN